MVLEVSVLLCCVSLLLMSWQQLRMIKVVRACEARFAAIDELADQVVEISHDFYGPDGK